jgi:hypothetical protein
MTFLVRKNLLVIFDNLTMDVTNLSTTKRGYIKAIVPIPPGPAALLGLKWENSNPVSW